jgi:DNA adenine methylase
VTMVATEPITMDAWHHWRGVMLGQEAGTELERGFATLFMNRTNRSGILKGGVIGGKAQAGIYRIDARFMRDELCKRLERIGQHAEGIHVYEEDAHELLRRCHQFLPAKSLIYLDPPYYVKGAGLYRNFYKHDDHVKIAQLLGKQRFSRPWVVSYDNADEIREMYAYATPYAEGPVTPQSICPSHLVRCSSAVVLRYKRHWFSTIRCRIRHQRTYSRP